MAVLRDFDWVRANGLVAAVSCLPWWISKSWIARCASKLAVHKYRPRASLVRDEPRHLSVREWNLFHSHLSAVEGHDLVRDRCSWTKLMGRMAYARRTRGSTYVEQVKCQDRGGTSQWMGKSMRSRELAAEDNGLVLRHMSVVWIIPSSKTFLCHFYHTNPFKPVPTDL